MIFADACKLLVQHLRNHSQTPLVVGERKYLFEAGPTSSDSELDASESAHGVAWPASYRTFMKTVGASRLFIDEYGRGLDFVAIDKLQEFSRTVFDNFGADPFPTLVLVVSIPKVGSFGGIATGQSRATENFAVFSPDDDPDLWLQEATFVDFGSWVSRITETNGSRTLV
jgi:hypothetical protein